MEEEDRWEVEEVDILKERGEWIEENVKDLKYEAWSRIWLIMENIS